MKKIFLWISSIHFGGRIFISKDLVLIAWRYIVIPNVIRTDIGSKFLILNLLFGGISGLPRQGTRNHVISESQAARMTALTLGGLVNDWTGSTFYLRAARFLCPEVQWSVYTLEVDLFSSVWFTRLRLEPFSISDRSLEVCVSCFDDFKHVMFCLHRSLMIWWMWNERAIDSDWFHLYIIIHASMVQVCSSLTLRQSSVTKGWVSHLGPFTRVCQKWINDCTNMKRCSLSWSWSRQSHLPSPPLYQANLLEAQDALPQAKDLEFYPLSPNTGPRIEYF